MKNLIKFIAIFFVFIANAYAVYSPPMKYKLSSAYGGTFYGSRDEVCQALMDKLNLTLTGADRLASIYVCSNNEGVRGNNQNVAWIDIHVVYRRVSGSTTTYTGGQIYQDCGTAVISGYPPNATCAGDPPPTCTAGDAGYGGIPQPAGSSESTLTPSTLNQNGCKNGCLTKLDPSRGNWYGGADGSSYNVYGYSNYTGATCTPSPSNPVPSTSAPSPNIKDCADSGKSYGTVNGVTVCVSAGTTGSAPVIQNKKGSSSTTTPAPTPENPNPTPVTTKQPDSVVITVPPSATSEGSVKTGQTNADGSTTSTTDTKDSFCSKNPSSEQCQAKSLCEKNPDAPSCKNICEQKPDLLVCKQTDIDQLCKEHPDRMECKKVDELIGKTSDLPNENLTEKEIKVGDNFNFNPVNIASNASCPSPQTIVIAGSPVTVSYDWICSYASAFRPLIIAFALFLAYGIIAAAIRSDSLPYQRGLF